MEAVWNLEDKWQLSTKQALLLLLFSASGVLGICVATTAALLRRLKSRKTTSPPPKEQLIITDGEEDWPPPMEPQCGWAAIKKALMSSLRWSGASKWRPEESMMMSSSVGSSWRETPLPLLMQKEMRSSEFHRDRDLESPVWQRPILMGEKCELPRYSGLILYDENGQLLCDVARKENSCKNTTTKVRT
ncbi:hypothetical protein TIFTF001_033043 [Ficus carica]|uniref:Uncharacterized protein n=1 Tax=Ficus carica TaxID=3494 RepID=A0AA88DZQ8_FICCA|nr:hypothetical protein TIFTF001_033043 [Ficus carica]